MAADNTEEIARLKTRLSEMLKKVPPSIGRAGLTTTRAYTEAVKKANKVMSNSRATLASVQASYQAMSSYWAN